MPHRLQKAAIQLQELTIRAIDSQVASLGCMGLNSDVWKLGLWDNLQEAFAKPETTLAIL